MVARGLLAAIALAAAACSPAPRVDLLIVGGTLIDGTGATPVQADLAIVGDRIHAVGDLGPLIAGRVIDARGRAVAPGFVDMHSHADLVLLAGEPQRTRLLEAKISQGVTTILVGNCGLGVAPSTDDAAAILAAVNGWMTPDGTDAGALSVAAYLDRLEDTGVPLNVATLVPHGPLRISELGLAQGEADPDSLARMRTAVAEALDAGAFGLSAGLIYPPGMYTPTTELVALAAEVAARDGLVTIHVRGSSESLLDATHELIEIGSSSGARVHHSHLEAVGEPFWPLVDDVLRIEDEARAAGVRISHDVFPYTRAATMMVAIFPPWSLEGGVDRLLDRLADATDRDRIRTSIESDGAGWHNLVRAVGWDGIVVASVASGNRPELIGRSLREIGQDNGRAPFDVVADLILAERGLVGQQVLEISGDVLTDILIHPAAAIVSDAEDYGRGTPHPAHAGAFARALRMNREQSLMPIETLVHKMTGYPARLIGLDDRGVLREGAAADLVVFDAETITDRASWDAPRTRAEGIRQVVIGGRVAIDDGRVNPELLGRVLRSTP